MSAKSVSKEEALNIAETMLLKGSTQADAYRATSSILTVGDIRKLADKVAELHEYGKGSRQVYSSVEEDNIRALRVFDRLKVATGAKNNVDIFLELEKVLPALEEMLKLGRELGQTGEKGFRAWVKRIAKKVVEDMDTVISGVDEDLGTTFGKKEEGA